MIKRNHALAFSILPSNNSDIKGTFRQLSPYLNAKAEGEVHSNQTIKQPENVLNDKGEGSCWYSPNEKGSHITLSFSRYSLFITNYSLKAPNKFCTQYYFPKEWTLYGFNGESWVLLSAITDANFSEHDQIKTFSVTELNHFETFSKFRFVNGKNSSPNSNQFIFAIQAIDLFGIVFNQYFTIRMTQFPNSHTLSTLLIILLIK